MSHAAFPVVVLPTYNEKENIARLIPEILKQDPRLKVLVVDDCSPDGTAQLVLELQKKHSQRIELIVRQEKGRGTAVLRGFKEALWQGATCVLVMDGDFSHSPQDLPRFLYAIEEHPVVVGSRFVPGGKIENRSWLRNFLSFLINRLIRLILGLQVRDASGGYRCFRAEVLRRFPFEKIVSHGFSLEPEILYRLKKQSVPVVEIPIVFINRRVGKSKVNLAVSLNYFLTLLKIRLSRS